MSGQLPTDPHRVVPWVVVRAAAWQQHAEAIGISDAQAARVRQAASAAEQAGRELSAIREAAKAATLKFRLASAKLRDEAAVVVRAATSKAYNEQSLTPFLKAELKPPADWSRRTRRARAPEQSQREADLPLAMPISSGDRTPGTPEQLAATLHGNSGELEISWQATHPASVRGATYLIYRGVAMPGQRQPPMDARPIGVVGTKRFVDATLPVGAMSVQYVVQAVSGVKRGAVSPILSVQIGSVRSDADAAPQTGRVAA